MRPSGYHSIECSVHSVSGAAWFGLVEDRIGPSVLLQTLYASTFYWKQGLGRNRPGFVVWIQDKSLERQMQPTFLILPSPQLTCVATDFLETPALNGEFKGVLLVEFWEVQGGVYSRWLWGVRKETVNKKIWKIIWQKIWQERKSLWKPVMFGRCNL